LLLGREVPHSHLDSFVERQSDRPLISPTRPTDAVDDGERVLVLEGRPCLCLENPNDLIERGERIEKDLGETQSAISDLIDQL
jgi:hypothetical protein